MVENKVVEFDHFNRGIFMSSLFEDLKAGLQEAIEFEKRKTTTAFVEGREELKDKENEVPGNLLRSQNATSKDEDCRSRK